MKTEHELPHYVHRKTAKGRTYYYFALDQNERQRRYVRLPDPSHPLFETRLAELYRQREAPRRAKVRFIAERKVYFIGSDDGPIKIGVSRDPEARCATMQVGMPDDVRVLATVAGGRKLELAYHERFAYARLRGEWFERHPDIIAEIERLARGTKTERENQPHSMENSPS